MSNQIKFVLTRQTLANLNNLQSQFNFKDLGQLLAFMVNVLTKILEVYKHGGRMILIDKNGKEEELTLNDKTIGEFIY